MIIQKKLPILLWFVLLGAVLLSCKKDEKNSLTVSPTTIQIPAEGGVEAISIKTNASSWSISNSADWVTLSQSSGTTAEALINFAVSTKTVTDREAKLTIKAGDANEIIVVVKQAASDYLYALSSDVTTLGFSVSGNTLSFKVSTTAESWSIQDSISWLSFSTKQGVKGETTVSLTSSANSGQNARQATFVIKADYAPAVTITVNQNGELYPNYNTNPIPADETGMESTAGELANKINIGWNIGNTLEAIGGETAWGNPMVSTALIDLVKQSGFNAIRIPCSFNQYMENSSTAKIKESWLNRVKTVVQYCVERDMYVLLNIHWDGGWLENNITTQKQEANNAKQKAFWQQIATHLRDFDEHLMFASANEPNVDNATQMAVLTSYHQTFIDAVRSTGGKNAYRVLVVQGPSTDIEKTNQLMKTLLVDVIANKMMVEVHYYTPWNFCGLAEDASWGKMFYYWGNGYHSVNDPERNATWGEESTVNTNFGLMRAQFVQKGIPVLLGEYSAMRRSALTGLQLSEHLASRAYYHYYITKKAKENGILPFYWDNGGMDNNACGIFNRLNNTVFDQQTLDALMQGANGRKK